MGTYAELFSGTTYGTFNGPLYGSGPPAPSGAWDGLRIIRQESRAQLRIENAVHTRTEPSMFVRQEA